MIDVSKLTLVVMLTLGSGGLLGFASGLMPSTPALAQDCTRTQPSCPPPSSSQPTSEPSSSWSSESSSEPSSVPSNEPYSEPQTPDGGNTPYDPSVGGDKRIDCLIRKDEKITNDLWLINIGEDILEVDTRVRFHIPSTGQRGAFLLPRDIPVGAERVLRNFLEDVEGGAECRIELID